MFVTLYDTLTGQIKLSGWADAEIIAPEGQSLMEGSTLIDGWVENGAFIEIPKQPSVDKVFNWATKAWENLPDEQVFASIRAKRNKLLDDSDWTQLSDVSLVTKTDWVTYRQALRDIPGQADPFNIIWPAAPGS